MKIKQLEWDDRGGHSVALSPFGAHTADDDGWWEAQVFGSPKAGRAKEGNRPSAKLACQADFERRVRECVEGEGVCVGGGGKLA